MTNNYPQTLEDAESRFFAWFERRFFGRTWRHVLQTCAAIGVPAPSRPGTIEEWREIARILNERVKERRARDH